MSHVKSKHKPTPPPRKIPKKIIHGDGTAEFKLNGTSFRVNARFAPIGIVGKGSYGVVCAAQNTLTREKVAIKKINPMCSDVWDAKHTLRELRLMRLLEHHPNVISLRDLNIVESCDELYIVMELMDSDLHKIIQSKQKLSHAHCQVLMKQILLGVNAMHAENVFHRDLKPGNILVGRDCQVRITDFGLARCMKGRDTKEESDEVDADGGNPASAMTEYVVTRWYRCPELLLAPHVAYTNAVDMWSVGCIFAEMVLREPLFPGRSYVHQVQLILETIGMPPSVEAMGFVPRSDAKAYLSRQKPNPGKQWEKILPKASNVAIDIISRLLIFNPEKRDDCQAALQHEYFNGTPELPCKTEEKTPSGTNLAPPPVVVDFSFDHDAVELDELKEHIHGEVKIMQAKNLNAARDLAEIRRIEAEKEIHKRIDMQKEMPNPNASKPRPNASKTPSVAAQGGQNPQTTSANTSPDSQVTDASSSTIEPSPIVPTTKKKTGKAASKKNVLSNSISSPSLSKAGSGGGKQMPTPIQKRASFKGGLTRTNSSGTLRDLTKDGSSTSQIRLVDNENEKLMSRTRSRLENAIASANQEA
ncbi:hypothetical protein TrLO_g1011 [Triparma laevis f. longispina]|uniref:Protein kinase domain-containing protein n=1 Tax=Triparma laevis f. longispina TaxID=1714387 RepID=A0A9W7E9K3_9STRA|nr:hypothetical protein TrLO_g1011 [Triparma laevis f. longispina]